MALYVDNPAGRLHRLITGFNDLSNSSPPRGSLPAWQTWAEVLGVETEDNSEILRCLGLVLALPGEIDAELARVSDADYDPDLVLGWQKIVPVLSRSMFSSEQSNPVAAQFDETSLMSLASCSWTLHRYQRQRLVDQTDLEHIRGLISELAAELRDAPDIDPGLHEFLLVRCEEMSRALRDVLIRGPVALEDALDQAWGAANRRADVTARADTAPGAWAKFTEVLRTTALVLGVMTSAVALPGEALLALEGPPPVQVEMVKPVQPPAPAAPAPAAEHGSGARRAPGKETATSH